MAILLPNHDSWNSLSEKIIMLPSIYIDKASCLYVLIKDVNKELSDFILTGKTEKREFHVFSREREQSMVSDWAQLGFDVKYHSQLIDYMGIGVTIKYLKIRNPVTGVCISLIPWFLVPGRHHPIFVYVYAVWYYHITGKKSLAEAAMATGELFKIEKLNKSTVSRSIKSMEHFIDVSQIHSHLLFASPSDMWAGGAGEEMVERVTEILADRPSIESLKEVYRTTIKQLPPPINPRVTIKQVLGVIPEEHCEIIKRGNPVRTKSRDGSKRPPRPRNANPRRVQRTLKFIDWAQREKIRREFIEICHHLVLDAAATYHLFLI